MCRHRGLISGANKSQQNHPGGTAFISPSPLTDRQVPFAAFVCVETANLTTITKPLTSNNNASLKSHDWSRRFQGRVWGMLLLFFRNGCMAKKSAAQGSISFQHCLNVRDWISYIYSIWCMKEPKNKHRQYWWHTVSHLIKREGVYKLLWAHACFPLHISSDMISTEEPAVDTSAHRCTPSLSIYTF